MRSGAGYMRLNVCGVVCVMYGISDLSLRCVVLCRVLECGLV